MKTNNNNNNNNTPPRPVANTRFIELLNLCVDEQLTPDEADELDAALLESPARRRTYEQYCRMSKACAQLFGTSPENSAAQNEENTPGTAQNPGHDLISARNSAGQSTGAASPFHSSPFTLHPSHTPALARALADAERKIQTSRAAARSASASRSTTSRPFFATWRGFFALGSLAAAGAAAAIVLILHTRALDASSRDTISAINTPPNATSALILTSATDTPAITSVAGESAVTAVAAPTTADVQPFSPSVLQPFAPLSGIQSMAKRFQFPNVTTLSGDNPQSPASADAAIAWTKNVRLRPISKVSASDSIENSSLIATPQVSATTPPVPPAAQDDADEMAAFQFHK